MKLSVYDLTCEYMEDPVGISVRHPRFSWKLKTDRQNVMQKAYEIRVSADPQFKELVWESGKVESGESVLIPYKGKKLKSSTRYFYKVRVWDNLGQESAYSEIAYFETAFLKNDKWRASFIIAPEEHKASPLFRKSFTLKADIKSARLMITSLGLYEFEINGKKGSSVLFAPGFTSYHKRLQYQTYDVTTLLQKGENAIGVMLGNGWYKGYIGFDGQKNFYGDRRALLAQLQVGYTDGRQELIVTDASWKTMDGPLLLSELYHGGQYDARLEIPGWSSPGFDDSAWEQPCVYSYSYDALTAQNTVPVKAFDRLGVKEIIHTPKGETVLDFGQNMTGYVEFTVQGGAGERVILTHAEVLDKDGNFYTDNMRSARNRIEYICRGEGEETFHPRFSFQGFRYVRVEDFPGGLEKVVPEAFTGIVVHSDMAVTGNFHCSNPMLNQLSHNILWGQKGNFLDIPTDCPQRNERLGWTGDAQMFIRTACFLMNTASFYTKWLQDLQADQTPEHGVPHVVPNVLRPTDCSSAAWGDAAVVCPWTVYLCYGDKRILEDQYDSMLAWIRYMRDQGENKYLYNTGFHFGDWLALDAKEDSYKGATPEDFIATAFYAYSTALAEKAAEALGERKDAARLHLLHSRIVKHFQEEFVTPSGRLASPTQTAHVLALAFRLVDGSAKKRTVETLVKMIQDNNCHLTTGFVGTPYLLFVLSENGYLDLAYQLLLQEDYPSWLYQVAKGATTVWEHWDGIKPDGSFWSPDMNSFNHYAYGAVGDWMYRVIGGIEADEKAPGYKHFYIKPKPGGGLTEAEASYQSLYGEIRSAWKIEKDGIHFDVAIPPNTTATVILPSRTVELGSGQYSFLEHDKEPAPVKK